MNDHETENNQPDEISSIAKSLEAAVEGIDLPETPAPETAPAVPPFEKREVDHNQLPQLDDVEVRVLGCLMEKKKTTPANYPLTLNSLCSACNQKSSRDPVVEYSERMVDDALEKLREKGIACRVSMAGSHVPKFRHELENVVNLSLGEYAVFCVLLLRGPQTVGQLRTRCERMHKFGSLEEVQTILNQLAHDYDSPVVCMLPREAGRKDHRYAHQLGTASAEQEVITEPDSPPELSEAPARSEELEDLIARVTQLEAQVKELQGHTDSQTDI